MDKIIVADDEPVECMAINKMLHELSLPIQNIKNAHDGEELVKIAKMEKPDIAIVDINMPELNGLDAIEMLHGFVPDMKIIIHSAYHDYLYMQRAIQLGATDYLLKPATRQDIGKAVEKALFLLKQERGLIEKNRKREDVFQQMQETVETGIMMSAVVGELDEKGFLIFLKSHPEASAGGYVIAVWQEAQEKKSLIDLRTQISSWLERYCVSISCIYQNTIYYGIFNSVTEEGKTWITPVVDGIFTAIKKDWKNVFIGISRYTQFASDSAVAIREAKIAMHMCSRESPVSYYPDKKLKETNRSLPIEIAVTRESDFNQIFSSEEVRAADILQLRLFCFDCCLQLQEACIQEEKWDLPELDTDIWKNLNALDTAAELKEWIRKRQKRIFQHKKPGNNYVEKCLIFIERNYNQDISLGDASEYAGVSSFYMTRLLKQETDKSFVQILTEVRIHKAVCMIRENQLTAAQIGDAVGYSNPVYFNRVFKKAAGMTVNQMKQLWCTGRIDGEEEDSIE